MVKECFVMFRSLPIFGRSVEQIRKTGGLSHYSMFLCCVCGICVVLSVLFWFCL